jgi:galacturan 1,4-alpha-galacturonidase
MKIAYIGGGSREWARKLMLDLALCPDIEGNVDLYDIDIEAAKLNEQLGRWLQIQPGTASHWRYQAVKTLPEALQGAQFVVVSIQPAPLEIMAEEIAIAERFGLYFPVGDTTGAPGLVRGLRSATIYEGFAHAIAQYCPDAWVINYTNPMAICTRTLTRVEPGLKVFGCCHEVFSTQKFLAELVHQVSPRENPSRDDIKINVMGTNHFTWIDRAEYKGSDLLALLRQYIVRPGVLRPFTQQEVENTNNYWQDNRQVKFNLFLRYQTLPCAGDRHLVEFLPGFVRNPETLFRWGIIRTPVAFRINRWKISPAAIHAVMEGKTKLPMAQSGEEGVDQMRALLGKGDLVTNVNMENTGQVGNLPLHVVVETNARFSLDQVTPINAGNLPHGLQPMIARQTANQEMIIEAALTKNKDLAFQAVYDDPASGMPVNEAWEMFNAMLRASKAYLPGWQID